MFISNEKKYTSRKQVLEGSKRRFVEWYGISPRSRSALAEWLRELTKDRNLPLV